MNAHPIGHRICAAITAIAVSAFVAAFVMPAESTESNRQKATQTKRAIVPRAPRPPLPAPHPHDVTLPNGEVVGRDPDPFIRLMIRRDPTPWLDDD